MSLNPRAGYRLESLAPRTAPRPFNPRQYFEFRIFKDFSGGITDQWYSHGAGLVHFYLDTFIPDDTVATEDFRMA